MNFTLVLGVLLWVYLQSPLDPTRSVLGGPSVTPSSHENPLAWQDASEMAGLPTETAPRWRADFWSKKLSKWYRPQESWFLWMKGCCNKEGSSITTNLIVDQCFVDCWWVSFRPVTYPGLWSLGRVNSYQKAASKLRGHWIPWSFPKNASLWCKITWTLLHCWERPPQDQSQNDLKIPSENMRTSIS